MKKVMLVMAVALMSALQVSAQNVKMDDKEIIGVWLMESMQWEGEKLIKCGKETGYIQFKYYGADGEYGDCTEMAVTSFQQMLGLTASGRYEAATHAALTSTLSRTWVSSPILCSASASQYCCRASS